MRSTVRAAITILLAALALAPAANAEMGWQSAAPIGPLGVPEPLGAVGGIAFQGVNRGVLITHGNGGVTPGIWAYDGNVWHEYATVCGGLEGRIAWSGPDEFWTVSNFASPQEGNTNESLESARTLCHFRNGEVVASYAQPFESPTGFRKMNAAACTEPNNCWFAGDPLAKTSPNKGPFHLRWDGAGLTSIPSLVEPQPAIQDPEGSITDLSFLNGSLFESATEAPFLREVNLGLPGAFAPVPLPEGSTGPFQLDGDAGQLWAVGDEGTTALRSIGAGFENVPLSKPLGTVTALASEPNGAAAWVGGEILGATGATATVTRIGADGEVSEPIELPGPSEHLSGKGGAAHIACPAPGQCWMVTTSGWLFHLGGPVEPEGDPYLHKLITFRPADESSRALIPAGVPPDTSGEVEPKRGNLPNEELAHPFREPPPPRALVFGVHQKVIHGRILQLSFSLRARAHVQLLAKRHRKVVAKTARMTLGKGPHRIRLKLDPKRPPTGLDFEVHPVGKG